MEEGSHDHLLAIKDGVYANLINMQSGREGEEEKEEESEQKQELDNSLPGE